MTVHVSRDAERIIRSHVQSGQFSSERDVIDAALGLLNERVQEPLTNTPVTEADFKQLLLKAGLMTSLPISPETTIHPEFRPLVLEGEALSETIIRERR